MWDIVNPSVTAKSNNYTLFHLIPLFYANLAKMGINRVYRPSLGHARHINVPDNYNIPPAPHSPRPDYLPTGYGLYGGTNPNPNIHPRMAAAPFPPALPVSQVLSTVGRGIPGPWVGSQGPLVLITGGLGIGETFHWQGYC